jgi:hypothetical protein
MQNAECRNAECGMQECRNELYNTQYPHIQHPASSIQHPGSSIPFLTNFNCRIGLPYHLIIIFVASIYVYRYIDPGKHSVIRYNGKIKKRNHDGV